MFWICVWFHNRIFDMCWEGGGANTQNKQGLLWFFLLSVAFGKAQQRLEKLTKRAKVKKEYYYKLKIKTGD